MKKRRLAHSDRLKSARIEEGAKAMQHEIDAKGKAGNNMPFGALAAKVRGFAARCVRRAVDQVAIWHDRRMMAEELEELDDRTLGELGLTRDQIPLVVRAYPAATKQFTQMLARVGLDTKEAPLDASTRGDLYRTCTMCAKRRRCRRWLASTKDVDGYPAFCPNAWMFSRLLEARRQTPA